MAKKTALTPDKFYEMLFTLVEKRGWFALTLPEIARATKTKLPELLQRYPDKNAVLIGFARLLDSKMAEMPLDDSAPIKDRLFELFMQRLDALRPFRAGVIRLMHELWQQPFSTALLGLEAGCTPSRSMIIMLDLAGVSPSKPFNLLAAMGLKIVYLAALRTWKDDESLDFSPTMATLDRALERWLKLTRLG